jgi:hypothetical protein
VSIIGIGRGIFKLTQGIIHQDGEKIMKGITGTVISVVGLAIEHVVDETVGQQISEKGEEASES